MKLIVPAFANGKTIPDEYAFGIKDPQTHVKLGDNKNPLIQWSNLPANTKSLALICVDIDVPTVGEDVNQAGHFISKDLPRTDFYHWVLIDIDPKRHEIKAGEDSNGITEMGKTPGKKLYGVTGINDYTAWFANDKDRVGNYGGYDGPCPPWNDERIHRYCFRLYALDVPSLNLSGNFTGQDVMQAMQGHILDEAEWVGMYSLNPNVTS